MQQNKQQRCQRTTCVKGSGTMVAYGKKIAKKDKNKLFSQFVYNHLKNISIINI